MATTVSMPQLGETVTEGTILRWAKQVGDTIAEDEVLVEISTDKVDTEVPSPAAGTILEILVNEGDTVSVGTALVVIGAEGEEAPAAEEAADETPPAEEKPAEETAVEEPPAPETTAEEPADRARRRARPGQRGSSRRAHAIAGGKTSDAEVDAFFAEPDETEKKPNLLSPVVRKLIRENEIDVSRLTGTGQGGRITRKDVEAYLESGPSEAAAPAAPADRARSRAGARRAASGAQPATAPSRGAPGRERKSTSTGSGSAPRRT